MVGLSFTSCSKNEETVDLRVELLSGRWEQQNGKITYEGKTEDFVDSYPRFLVLSFGKVVFEAHRVKDGALDLVQLDGRYSKEGDKIYMYIKDEDVNRYDQYEVISVTKNRLHIAIDYDGEYVEYFYRKVN